MSQIIKIEGVEHGAGLPQTVFCGELVPGTPEPRTDFALTDISRRSTYAGISGYPRWTESRLALFLRLLRVSKPIPELGAAFGGLVTVTVAVHGEGYQNRAGLLELAQIELCANGGFQAHLISPELMISAQRISLDTADSLQEVIRRALSEVLGWNLHVPPAPPPPLSSVRVRRAKGGGDYVLIQDVAPLPRAHLRRLLSLSSRARRVSAEEWKAFLRSLGERAV